MATFLTMYTRRDVATMAFIAASFVIASIVGRFFFTAPAVFQPAAGIALAALVLAGVRMWPGVVIGSLMNGLILGSPLIPLVGYMIGHALHAVAGAGILRLLGFDPVFRRVRDMFAFLFVAMAVAAIVPTVGLLSVYLHNLVPGVEIFPNRATWITWWAGIMVGNLILGATLIRFFVKKMLPRSKTEIGELIVAFALLGILSYLTFWTDATTWSRGVLVLFYLIPFVWFSLRLGNRFTFLAFFFTMMIALTGALHGELATDSATISRRLISTEFFLATLAVIFYLFTAVVEERKKAIKLLSEQLRRVNDLLDQARSDDRAKSEFIAIFAHELRNPLAPIVSSIELLKLRWGAHPEISPIIETLQDRTSTIVRLLDDLLDVSRISRQNFRIEKEHIDLRERVAHAVESVRPLAEKNHQTLLVTQPSHSVPIYADPVRVEQVISNLLMNSIKYTHEGGSIMLRLENNGDDAALRIQDDGIGIPRELLPHIFLPFSELGADRQQHTRMKKGLGIGLWIAENLVKAHGGSIEAHSEGEGRGSEFIVRLPKAKEPAAVQAEPVPIRQRDGKMKVLVVDDNEAAAQGLGTLLEYSGNTVALAYDGAGAVEKSREFGPDAVVLDIGLPDISGYEVAQMLRQQGFDGRLVALTGYDQEEDKKKAAAAGFDLHLTKPVGIADLQAALIRPQAV